MTAYLAHAFSKLRVRCVFVDNIASLGPDQVAFATRGDALPAVSFEPYTPATVEIAARMAETLPVVATTDSVFSPLTRSATTWFEVAEGDFVAVRAISGTFALAITLAVGVAQKRGSSDGQPAA